MSLAMGKCSDSKPTKMLLLLLLLFLIDLQVEVVHTQWLADYTQHRKIPGLSKKHLMPSRKNSLTGIEREELADNCEPIGGPCLYAEKCCSNMCFKVTRTCII